MKQTNKLYTKFLHDSFNHYEQSSSCVNTFLTPRWISTREMGYMKRMGTTQLSPISQRCSWSTSQTFISRMFSQFQFFSGLPIPKQLTYTGTLAMHTHTFTHTHRVDPALIILNLRFLYRFRRQLL